jgi:peptide/nickel transport system ATP-binding protein
MTTIEVRDLVKTYQVRQGRRREQLRAVNGVSFTLHPGQTTALVGESGSGKSTVARILARLATPTSGDILLDGTPMGTRAAQVRQWRKRVQMIFQDPFSSLNPTHTVGYHLRRPLRIHGIARDRQADRDAVAALLDRVHLGPADAVAARYPHELSGGQRQRVAIARALAPQPGVLLADEPVSMLDVSIRLEILNLIDELKAADDLAVLYITHDLATARHFASTVMVMYRGEIVESGPSDEVILRPAHPYTRLLASAAPDPMRAADRDGTRAAAGGPDVARRTDSPAEAEHSPAEAEHSPAEAEQGNGCPFRERCPSATPICGQQRPAAFTVGTGHTARCWLHQND